MSARRKAKVVQHPDSGAQQVVTRAEKSCDEAKNFALEALGSCMSGAPGALDDFFEALEVDLDVLHLAMTNDQCDAFAINNYVLRLVSRVRLLREIYRAERGA